MIKCLSSNYLTQDDKAYCVVFIKEYYFLGIKIYYSEYVDYNLNTVKQYLDTPSSDKAGFSYNNKNKNHKKSRKNENKS